MNYPTKYTRSPHLLPNWVFSILLALIFIGAPISFIVGFSWGCVTLLPSPLARYDPGAEGFTEWLEVFGCGVAGVLIGVPILAVVATCGYWFFFLLRHAARTLGSTAVRLFCDRRERGTDKMKRRERRQAA